MGSKQDNFRENMQVSVLSSRVSVKGGLAVLSESITEFTKKASQYLVRCLS